MGSISNVIFNNSSSINSLIIIISNGMGTRVGGSRARHKHRPTMPSHQRQQKTATHPPASVESRYHS